MDGPSYRPSMFSRFSAKWLQLLQRGLLLLIQYWVCMCRFLTVTD